MTYPIVVTAFFSIKSKEPPSFYYEKSKAMLKTPALVILFTSSKHADYFREIRGDLPIKIVTLAIDDYGMPEESPVKSWVKESDWTNLYNNLSKRHPNRNGTMTVSLMQMWLNKAWFLTKASLIEENVDKNTPFVWCDIGCVRNGSDAELIKTWPSTESIYKKGASDQNKIYFIKRLPLKFSVIADQNSPIDGSCIIVYKSSLQFFLEDVKKKVIEHTIKYNDAVFDETIYMCLLLENKDKYSFISESDIVPTDIWGNWFTAFKIFQES